MSIIDQIKTAGSWKNIQDERLEVKVAALASAGRITLAQESYAKALISQAYRAAMTDEDRAAEARMAETARILAISKKNTRKPAAKAKPAPIAVGQHVAQGEVIATDGKTLTVRKVDGSHARVMARLAQVVAA